MRISLRFSRTVRSKICSANRGVFPATPTFSSVTHSDQQTRNLEGLQEAESPRYSQGADGRRAVTNKRCACCPCLQFRSTSSAVRRIPSTRNDGPRFLAAVIPRWTYLLYLFLPACRGDSLPRYSLHRAPAASAAGRDLRPALGRGRRANGSAGRVARWRADALRGGCIFYIFSCAARAGEMNIIFFAHNWFARAGASRGSALSRGF